MSLQCQKPSNLATLTWKSSQLNTDQEKHFIQSADGSLSFLATSATFGTYICEAEEGGHREAVVIYKVQQIVSPRSVKPHPTVSEHDRSDDEEETYEDIKTMEPWTSSPRSSDPDSGQDVMDGVPRSSDPDSVEHFKEDVVEDNCPNCKFETNHKQQSRLITETSDPPEVEPHKEKSYFTELVVVSLLLVVCICGLILLGLHVGCQTKARLLQFSAVRNKKDNNSTESVPSLSGSEDAGLEVKTEK